jgi:predicted AAA+ superfamily ATPase
MLYHRDILKTIESELSQPDILILLGSRQVGKTTILEMLSQTLKERQANIIFLDMDIETNLDYFRDYESITQYIKFQGYDPKETPLYLLLDEFQRVQGAGKTLKNLYDHHKNIKIIATGSSSLEINKTISESMAGRKMVFRVFPLNFREFLVFKNQDQLLRHFDQFNPADPFPGFIQQQYNALFEEKLIYGSFPEVVLQDNLERKGRKIEDILNSYLRKDIKEQLSIKDTVQFKRVLELVGITAGNLLNINSIAQELGTYFRKVDELFNVAVETYVVDPVRPFARNRKNEIVRNPKAYFEDTGMRNFLIKNMTLDLPVRSDTGLLVENFVYNELVQRVDIFTEIKYWRTKNGTEVDFVLIKDQQILPIEVKSGAYDNLPKGLISFCKKENLDRAIIITKNISKTETRDNIEFLFIPHVFAAKIPNLLR